MRRGEISVNEPRFTAICLAAGRGSRMESDTQKQYLLLREKPMLYYSLKAFQESFVDSVVLVTGKGDEEYCRHRIVEPYGFDKVEAIVAGGRERYHSVYHGLAAAGDSEYIFIHDSARPFLTREILRRTKEGVTEHGACVVGMPVKDTIKLADENDCIDTTPDRSRVWTIQTPQAFRADLIRQAYEALITGEKEGRLPPIPVTDDAMVVEYYLQKKVHLIPGSYRNIKITTPEDMLIAEAFLGDYLGEF